MVFIYVIVYLLKYVLSHYKTDLKCFSHEIRSILNTVKKNLCAQYYVTIKSVILDCRYML